MHTDTHTTHTHYTLHMHTDIHYTCTQTHIVHIHIGVRWLSGWGIGLLIRRLPVRFLAVQSVLSLGKASPCTYCKSL